MLAVSIAFFIIVKHKLDKLVRINTSIYIDINKILIIIGAFIGVILLIIFYFLYLITQLSQLKNNHTSLIF